jgi:hypothetical protein
MDTRVIIDIDFNEYDFIKGAVREKTQNLLNYMDRCLDDAVMKDKFKDDPRMPKFAPKKQVVKKKIIKKPIRKTK